MMAPTIAGNIRSRTMLKRLLFLVITSVILLNDLTTAQRSLQHWKHDLELRLRLYDESREAVYKIISSAVSAPGRGSPLSGDVRISSNGNVRFSQLIVPTGSLILESGLARPTVRVLVDKTSTFINSKLKDLQSIRRLVSDFAGQLRNGSRRFIYKGSPGLPQPQYNATLISGTHHFRQVSSAQVLESPRVTLTRINGSDVNRVVQETYLNSSRVKNVFDLQGRLFFEGRKTFHNTVFTRALISGCCDRMRPLHTSRMMLRSQSQQVIAPIVLLGASSSRLHANNRSAARPSAARVIIRRLDTGLLSNQRFALGAPPQYPSVLGPAGLTFYSAPENLIRPSNMISLYQMDQPKLFKTLVFKSAVVINEAQRSGPGGENKMIIGIYGARERASPTGSPPTGARLAEFDLAHDNYLLRFSNSRSSFEQHVRGFTWLEAPTRFQANLQAESVNQAANFGRFVRESMVRTDRPARIEGRVHFDSMAPLGASQLMVSVRGALQVGRLNGMIPARDMVVFPSAQNPYSLLPNTTIHVHGLRRFAGPTGRLSADSVRVAGLVNGIRVPEMVIPLDADDFVGLVGHSNLLFVDGLTTSQLIIQGGRLDDILLREVNVDAQSLVMDMAFPRQPDGSILVRAPLRVTNLNLLGASGSGRGLLNGFRPREVLQLTPKYHGFEALHGRKSFAAPVEAADCIIQDINQVASWSSQLIRIDRANIAQSVQTRLAFVAPSSSANRAQLQIDTLNVPFRPAEFAAANWQFSPEFYLMHQALARFESGANHTGGRYLCRQLRLLRPDALVNNIALDDIVTLDKPFKFRKQFTIVGKVVLEHGAALRANRIQSNYPLDKLDLVQFNQQRIPLLGSRAPIRLSNLVLDQENSAAFVESKLVNGAPFSEFAGSIMSLTRPQVVESELHFDGPVSFEAPLHTRDSALNGVKHFEQFAARLKNAKYLFEDGLQCNTVVLRSAELM